VSPVTIASPDSAIAAPIARALTEARRRFPSAPVDKIELQLKGDQPTVTIYTGKPTGGEDRKLTFDARNGAMIADESSVDKPFLYRLHSGEAFGDGGLVVAMFWGLALLVLTITGLIIYFMMRRSNLTGIRRIFW